MTNQVPLSADTLKTIERASIAARERHHPYIDIEHLLFGALGNEFVQQAATQAALAVEPFMHQLGSELGMVRDDPMPSTNGLTSQAKAVIFKAWDEAKTLGSQAVTSAHLALTILQTPTPVIQEILQSLPPLQISELRAYIKANAPQVQAFNSDMEQVGAAMVIGQSAKLPVSRTNAPTASQQRRVTVSFGKPQTQQKRESNTWAVLGGAFGVLFLVLYGVIRYPDIAIPFTIVLGGWIISLTLHEFGHALVAYLAGDDSVKDKGYLTMNPLKYTHPLLSIVFPLFFLLIGGIGLPGGAVFIDRERIIQKHSGFQRGYGRGGNSLNSKTRYWLSAVALAGPVANFMCLIFFSAPFWSGYLTIDRVAENINFWGPLAFLCLLQVMAIFINLLPIPPLDGFNIIEPFLPSDLVMQLRSFGMFGIILVFLFLQSPAGDPFYQQIYSITEWFNVPIWLASLGYDAFRFWGGN